MKFSLDQVQAAVHLAQSRLSMRRLTNIGPRKEPTYILTGPDALPMNGKEYETVRALLRKKQVNIVANELGIESWPLKDQILFAMKNEVTDLETAFVKHLGYRIYNANNKATKP